MGKEGPVPSHPPNSLEEAKSQPEGAAGKPETQFSKNKKFPKLERDFPAPLTASLGHPRIDCSTALALARAVTLRSPRQVVVTQLVTLLN